jgi:hypothetical protein
VAIWYIFPRFGILCHKKSGNPVSNHNIGPRSATTRSGPTSLRSRASAR